MKLPRATTRKFVKGWIICFLLLLITGLGYQMIVANDSVPNNAISHVVAELTEENPLVPLLFCGVAAFVFVGVVMCAWHWWFEGFSLWPKAKWVDERDEDEDK